MAGFGWLAGLAHFCGEGFYARFRWLRRKRQSKGYGVHSPFAFDLITNVIHSPHRFYAFSDIPALLSRNGIDPASIIPFNHLSFRLVYHLRPANILEVNSGTGINTLFLLAPSTHTLCTCVEDDAVKAGVAEELQEQTGRQSEIVPSPAACEGRHYDAIFINFHGSRIPPVHTLAKLSHPDAFWVFHPINKGRGKQFWDEIVHDVRVRMTFDLEDTGIAFLKPDFHKENYYISRFRF